MKVTMNMINKTNDLDQLVLILADLSEKVSAYQNWSERRWYNERFLNLVEKWETTNEKIMAIDDEHPSIYAGEGLGYYDIGDVLA